MVITTTLRRRSTPRPLATMFMIFRTSEIMTTLASNALKTSNKNIMLLANVLRMISIKNNVKNTLSICANSESGILNISAIVN